MLTLTGSELLVIYPLPASANFEATPDGLPVLTPEIVTINEVVIAGGGGYADQQIINSGTAATQLVVNAFIGFNSAALAPKTLTIPTSAGNLGKITISDLAGTAERYPITPVPVSGTILDNPTVSSNYGSITLLDSQAGWVSI